MTLAKARQGLGHAREALVSVLDQLLLRRGRHRAVAQVGSRHAPIQDLLRRLSFRDEGDDRQNVIFKGGWSAERSYALLASKWPAGASRFR